MAVGWIEASKPYEKGNVHSDLIKKIKTLNKQFGEAFPAIQFRGQHQCTLCAAKDSQVEYLNESHVNLVIPYKGFVFVAPGRIDHYIKTHGYLPPESFIDAVLQCHSPLSNDYRKQIKKANRGYDAPLFN